MRIGIVLWAVITLLPTLLQALDDTAALYIHIIGGPVSRMHGVPEPDLEGIDIEILGNRRQAKVLNGAAYDPKNKRLKS